MKISSGFKTHKLSPNYEFTSSTLLDFMPQWDTTISHGLAIFNFSFF